MKIRLLPVEIENIIISLFMFFIILIIIAGFLIRGLNKPLTPSVIMGSQECIFFERHLFMVIDKSGDVLSINIDGISFYPK